MSKQIQLTQGKFATVDDDDYEYVVAYKWHARTAGINSKWYATRKVGEFPFKRNLHLHIFLMSPPAGMEVDHINGDGLDNRRENLRIVTHSQNMMNRGKYRNNTSGFKGVFFHADGKWRAQIVVNGKTFGKYGFTTAEEAARYYDDLAIEHHGEFAVLNFPRD